MKTVTLNRFDGGIADPRETSTNMCTSVRNFYPQKTKLTPYRDMETDVIGSGSLSDNRLTDVIKGTILNGSTPITSLFALGRVSYSTDQNPKFYTKNGGVDPTTTWDVMTNGEGSGIGTVVANSAIIYKGNLYCLVDDGTNTKLVKHIYATSTLSVGTIGTSPTFSVVVPSKMFIHPKDNRLYMFSGYTMGVWDGSTLSTRAFGTDYNIVSACPSGNNILIGMVAKDESHSVAGIWSGSTTSSELVDVVRWGDDALLVLENIGDSIIGVSAMSIAGSSTLATQSAVVIREYNGGAPRVVRKIESVGGSRVYAHKATRNDTLYFTMDVYLNGTRTKQVWAISRGENGQWQVRPDRKVNNDTEITTDDITGLSSVGDYMWVATTTGLMHTNDQDVFSATSIYETLINPSMEIGDRTKKKLLKSVSCAKAHNTGNIGQVVVKYSVDGGQNWATIGTLASAGGNVFKATNESSGKPFEQAYDYIFRIESTLGAEIVEFKYAYEVVNELI